MASRVVATGMTRLGKHPGVSALALKADALHAALNSAGLKVSQLDGLLTVPTLSEALFLDAHHLAMRVGLVPSSKAQGVVLKTIDTGGAGPISAVLDAHRMIQHGGCHLVAVVAGDAVASIPSDDFLRRADASCTAAAASAAQGPEPPLQSPVIPHGYDRVAAWAIAQGHVTREQLAMVAVLMSRQASRHPMAMTRAPHSLAAVLGAQRVASATGLLECARRADGAAAVLLASEAFLRQHRGSFAPHALDNMPVVLGGGEASGPLIPPARGLSEDVFSCSKAAARAYAAAGGLTASDVDYFGIYDCFPICFVRALEGVGLAPPGGGGGRLVQQWYENEDAVLPLNTHGGLLGQGAPWEAPALFSLCEAVAQMTGAAGDRQLGGPNGRRNRTCDTALVYGNGGIFSASAVVVLGKRPL